MSWWGRCALEKLFAEFLQFRLNHLRWKQTSNWFVHWRGFLASSSWTCVYRVKYKCIWKKDKVDWVNMDTQTHLLLLSAPQTVHTRTHTLPCPVNHDSCSQLDWQSLKVRFKYRFTRPPALLRYHHKVLSAAANACSLIFYQMSVTCCYVFCQSSPRLQRLISAH